MLTVSCRSPASTDGKDSPAWFVGRKVGKYASMAADELAEWSRRNARSTD